MPLTHAPFCTRCGQHHTKHPSGICSLCRRLKGRKPCSHCGEYATLDPSGLCHRCRGKAAGAEYLDAAISHHKDVFIALTMLQSGYSYQQIGQAIGKSKSSAFSLCQSALHHRQMALTTEDL